MFRSVLVAVVVLSGAALAAISPALPATLNVTPPPMRPVYPHLHLNSPLHSRIAPRVDHDIGPREDCAAVAGRNRPRLRRHDCRPPRPGATHEETIR